MDRAGMNAPDQDESEPFKPPPMAAAMIWVNRIISICLEMVVPAVGGYWLDRYFGTRFLVVLGVLFGAALGFWQLMSITRSLPGSSGKDSKSGKPEDRGP
jgi:hypothetical protein